MHLKASPTCPLLLTTAAALLVACSPGGSGQAEADGASPVDPLAVRDAAAPGTVLVNADEWHVVDRRVDVRGLDVRFPDADGRDEVQVWEGGPPWPYGGIGPSQVVALTASWQDVRVEMRGVAFEVRVRGTEAAVGAELTVGIEADPDSHRLGGKLELEDERGVDAWIEVEHARLVKADEPTEERG